MLHWFVSKSRPLCAVPQSPSCVTAAPGTQENVYLLFKIAAVFLSLCQYTKYLQIELSNRLDFGCEGEGAVRVSVWVSLIDSGTVRRERLQRRALGLV